MRMWRLSSRALIEFFLGVRVFSSFLFEFGELFSAGKENWLILPTEAAEGCCFRGDLALVDLFLLLLLPKLNS